jgi:hypothetical protein
MEAKDLMIDCLYRVKKDVCLPKGTIVVIRGIDADNRFPERHLIGSATCLPVNSEYVFTYGVWVEYLEPISIIPEILEKNGFKRNRYNYIYKDDYCEVCVSFVPKIKIDDIELGEPAINVSIKGALFDINMSMSAIHELQQAMRLLGIEKEIIL